MRICHSVGVLYLVFDLCLDMLSVDLVIRNMNVLEMEYVNEYGPVVLDNNVKASSVK